MGPVWHALGSAAESRHGQPGAGTTGGRPSPPMPTPSRAGEAFDPKPTKGLNGWCGRRDLNSHVPWGCEMWEEDGGRTRKWQRERWRRDWIARFAEWQRVARRWIAFVDLVDWGAHSTTAASANAEAQARDLLYRRLSESLLRGAFIKRAGPRSSTSTPS